eukprot:SAG31_NODE_4157_length_3525_cov_1.686515_4_plen_89_part_00
MPLPQTRKECATRGGISCAEFVRCATWEHRSRALGVESCWCHMYYEYSSAITVVPSFAFMYSGASSSVVMYNELQGVGRAVRFSYLQL